MPGNVALFQECCIAFLCQTYVRTKLSVATCVIWTPLCGTTYWKTPPSLTVSSSSLIVWPRKRAFRALVTSPICPCVGHRSPGGLSQSLRPPLMTRNRFLCFVHSTVFVSFRASEAGSAHRAHFNQFCTPTSTDGIPEITPAPPPLERAR